MAIKKRIIIAAGHGGGDPGVVARGRKEANEAIKIKAAVVKLLKADGRILVSQVPDSYGLSASINWVNRHFKNLNDGICIEIHKNAGGGTGTEIWHGNSTASRNLALKATATFAKYSGLRNRGAKNHKTNRHGQLGWIANTNTWSLLYECGFIDVDHFNTSKYAEGVYRSILKLFNLKPKTTPKPKPVKPKWVSMNTPRNMIAKKKTEIINLDTNKRVGDIDEGISTPFVEKKTVGKKLYLRSKWSTANKKNWGVLLTQLDEVPEPKPPKEPPVVDPVEDPKIDPTPDNKEPTDNYHDDIADLNNRLTLVEKFIEYIKSFFKK